MFGWATKFEAVATVCHQLPDHSSAIFQVYIDLRCGTASPERRLAARFRTNDMVTRSFVRLVLSAKLFRNLTAIPLEKLGFCILRGRDDDSV